MRLLWVEDELAFAQEGAEFLGREGFAVSVVPTAQAAWELLRTEPVDLVLLDWMLPDESGIELCRRIQRRWGTPVIMLTARSDETDKVAALESGADDYLAKPFSLRELAARIRAVMRRLGREGERRRPEAESVLRRGDLTIDLERLTVYRGREEIRLTPTEFRLLGVLAGRPGRVYTRSQLMDAALGETYVGLDRTVDSHIRNLRKKLGDCPDRPRYILTVHGVGYKFAEG
jgi:DNA-binding response OmpR family regulator